MPLQLQPHREIALIGAGAALVALAVYLDRRDDTPRSVGTLRRPLAGTRNPLDRLAYRTEDSAAARLADVGLYGGPALPLVLSLHPRTRPRRKPLLLVWLQTLLLTFGLTSVIKNLANRPRPYVLHPEFSPERLLVRRDRASFLSGHTSMATAGATLFARYLGYQARRRGVILGGWILAGGVAGFTAFLRVKAGKHWPTDALAGLLLGGLVAREVPAAHEASAA